MQGNGTQESPYIPETWDEFVTAVGTSGAFVSMPEGGYFDMNEIAPEGGISITIQCKSIEGNNWEIRNAYNTKFKNNSRNRGLIINRLHFLDFYIDSISDVFDLEYCNLYNCKLSGDITGISSKILTYGTYNNCSMNFKFIGGAIQVCNKGVTCNFVNAIIDHSDSEASNSAVFNPFAANNSFIEHKSNANGITIALTSSKSSIVHSDAGNFVINSTGSKVEVSEEQLKDVAYLRSIGFPIAGD